jgi:hypothetical protein
MARRRYGKPSPAISTAGQAAQPRDPSGDESLSQPIEPRAEYGKPPPESTAEPAQPVTGLGEQMRAQQAYAQQQQIAQLHGHIDQIPNLSPAQRHWLHNNPHGLYRFDLLHAAHTEAQQRGVPVDSPEYFHFLSAMLNSYGHLPPQQPAQMQPAPAPAPPPITHVDLESHEPEPDNEPMPSHHVSAPVSRGDTAHSIEPQLTPGQVRLSPEERELCQMNKIDEVKYAEGKLRLAKQKAAKIRE